MRIVTRPDFDGVVCAVLLFEVEEIDRPVKWAQPDEIQTGRVDIGKGDILANLPYDRRCSRWFDHHYSNRIEAPFDGSFRLAPSAARVVFEHYAGRFNRDFSALVRAADKIDAAELSMQEVLHPEKDPYFLVSLTLPARDEPDQGFLDRLVELFRRNEIDRVLNDSEVRKKCSEVRERGDVFKELLRTHTVLRGKVSLTDFRPVYPPPGGNRFLVYTVFPQATVSLFVRYADDRKDSVRVSAGRNIFNPVSETNIGSLLRRYGGGGHRYAGGCTLDAADADERISQLLDHLREAEG